MADPFVLLHDGVYYAYGTAPGGPNGEAFRLLRSTDLIHWEDRGWALAPLAGADDFWAPEVAYDGGRFYLYYSAHGINGADHQLRVAVSESPLGPFHDAGTILTPDDPFTIDAHPFRDVDGQWYLFYARDFLTLDDDYRVGTGIVVDRLVNFDQLAGEPRTVVRPHHDWQLFQAQRLMYGSTYDWHTIEGAAMRVHNGRYYCFYSGGAWEQQSYGISYVTADQVMGPYARPTGVAEPIFRSVPDKVIGPGHNSFVTGPDGREYAVYHAWDPAMTARLMRVDRLTWEGDQPRLHGPTWTPQPFPNTQPR